MSTRRIVKPTGWVVDMRHYLDEETGDLPEAVPERVLNLAVFFGAIVAWVTDHLPEGDWLRNVPCRRSPGRRRCRGEIVAELERASGRIVWHCPLCGDNGLIHGWEDTPWDRQHDAGAAPTSTPPPTTHRRVALTSTVTTRPVTAASSATPVSVPGRPRSAPHTVHRPHPAKPQRRTTRAISAPRILGAFR